MQATACLALHCNQDRVCVDFWNLCVRDSAIAGHVIWARGVVLVPTVLATSPSILLGKELNCALFWVGMVLLGGGQVLAFTR